MSRFGCVLFDLDGTMFDTSEGIFECYRLGLEHFGIHVEDDRELFKVLGPSLYTSYHEFFGLTDEQTVEAIKIYRSKYTADGIYKCRMYDGIKELLKSLKNEGVKICTCTSKPYVMAENIVDFSGIKEYFDVVCGTELSGRSSNKLELINKSLERAGFSDKSDAVMIGDRLYDIKGASDAGVHSIGVTYGFGTREELVDAGAEYIADSAEDIRKIILG